MTKFEDWLTIGLFGFLGGIVANIIIPSRRGVLGFMSAAVIGVFCGGISGIVANSYEVHYGFQYGLAASVGVLGDRILTAVLHWKFGSTTVINNGPSQNQFGKDGNQEQNDDDSQ